MSKPTLEVVLDRVLRAGYTAYIDQNSSLLIGGISREQVAGIWLYTSAFQVSREKDGYMIRMDSADHTPSERRCIDPTDVVRILQESLGLAR